MKIQLNTINDYTARIPVWFGRIKNGMVWNGDQIDFEQSRRRASLKQYLKEQEDLELHLKRWAERAGF